MNKRWLVVLAFCGVFLAGAFVGGLVVRRGVPTQSPPARHEGRRSLDHFASATMKRYTARLGLDEAQREQVRSIVAQAESELRAVRSRTFAETVAIGDRMNAQVEPLLRADQRERFETLKQDVKRYWERERTRRNGSSSGRSSSRDGTHKEKGNEKH